MSGDRRGDIYGSRGSYGPLTREDVRVRPGARWGATVLATLVG